MKPSDKNIHPDYIGRINLAIRYIEENLDQELKLATVAKVALYSPFHFHRIFSAIVKESPQEFINRKRIEKSTRQLKPDNPRPIASIAQEHGFSSNAAYTKAFKKYYGISPSKFRDQNHTFSKIGKVDSKNGQSELVFSSYICNIDEYKRWMKEKAKIEVRVMPSQQVAYVTHHGAFDRIGEAYQKLMRWAIPKGLGKASSIMVYHDDPNITDMDKLRQAAGIILEKPMAGSGEVSMMSLQAGRYGVGRFAISPTEFEKAWQSMFVWIYENGYEALAGDCYQISLNKSKQNTAQKYNVEIYVPIN